MERKTWNPPLYPPITTRTNSPWQLLFQLFSIWQICNKREYKKSFCSLQCDICSAICFAINEHQFTSLNMDTLNVSCHWLFYSTCFCGTAMLKHLHRCVLWTYNLPHISAEIVRMQLDQASSMVASQVTWSSGHPHKHTHTHTHKHTNTYAYLHASSKHYNCKPVMSYQHLYSRNRDMESLDGETQHLKKPFRQNSCSQHTHL